MSINPTSASFTAIVSIDLATVVVGTIGRLWILRHRERTLLVNVSDGEFVLFGVLAIASSAVSIDGITIADRIRRIWGYSVRDKEDMAGTLLTEYYRSFFVVSFLCTIQIWLLKAAFLGYYFAWRQNVERRVKALIDFATVYCAVSFVVVVGFQLGYCWPLERNWATGDAKCIPVLTTIGMRLQSWTNMGSDLLLITIPLLTILPMSLGRRERYALIMIFSIGALSLVATIIRYVQVKEIVKYAVDSVDAMRGVLVWTTVEKLLAFVAFCLPSLRVLFSKAEKASKCGNDIVSVEADSRELGVFLRI
ncbi:hypothetical protein RUND412_006660 [Rhizina undulata]